MIYFVYILEKYSSIHMFSHLETIMVPRVGGYKENEKEAKCHFGSQILLCIRSLL